MKTPFIPKLILLFILFLSYFFFILLDMHNNGIQ